MKPALARATAPVTRFCEVVSVGRMDEVGVIVWEVDVETEVEEGIAVGENAVLPAIIIMASGVCCW